MINLLHSSLKNYLFLAAICFTGLGVIAMVMEMSTCAFGWWSTVTIVKWIKGVKIFYHYHLKRIRIQM